MLPVNQSVSVSGFANTLQKLTSGKSGGTSDFLTIVAKVLDDSLKQLWLSREVAAPQMSEFRWMLQRADSPVSAHFPNAEQSKVNIRFGGSRSLLKY